MTQPPHVISSGTVLAENRLGRGPKHARLGLLGNNVGLIYPILVTHNCHEEQHKTTQLHE